MAPDLIADALGGQPLPFVSTPVSDDYHLKDAIGLVFDQGCDLAGGFCRTDVVSTLSDALCAVSGQARGAARSIDQDAMKSIRERLVAEADSGISMSQLERDHGLDRFSICRQFRRAFGVTPHRFVTMRRLDLAKRHIRRGKGLADAAAAAGFSDQSHMTRHFRKAFGISPGNWRNLVCKQRPDFGQKRESQWTH